MKVAISGSTGFLAGALIPHLEAAGHTIVRMVRPATKVEGAIRWDPASGELDPRVLEGIDAVVHLAGRGIGKRPFTRAEKRRLWESRVPATELVARAIAACSAPPSVLLSASAVGYYGDRGVQTLDEESGPGRGFLADLCRAWEDATAPARGGGTRVVRMRTGIVLGRGGPLFKRLVPAFRVGVGGRLGDGTQYQPWITLHDWVRAAAYVLAGDIEGAVNLVGPAPATNAELVRAIGRAMRRPAVMVVPRFAVALALGRDGADDLLASQRAVPRVLQQAGFGFEHPTLEAAMASALG